ncbi:hypothetical protein [Psychroflexus montanilacus]|uniref:hypothetical protein n=1 Tax=Psychroflexus montanilacus TaxID=2873598 RepID=UPI001CC9A136|nr:hypothetical protein [Psychroflexus montanilacus]MBZ9650881.1 hypothetical protein [Psychroflexus montanilacus]
MKKKLYTLLLLFSALAGLGSLFLSCDSDDDSTNCQGIDCLPPATTTGEGTFGCLVNGEPFVDNSGAFNCFYQLVDGEYFFSISPNFEGKKLVELDLGSNAINFSNSPNFIISDYSIGNGGAAFFISGEGRNIQTNMERTGICDINYFNNENNIISGTFEFEIFDEVTQTLYIVTEGRFDAIFTQ